ncbi:thiamine pyrophosphokinase [Paxillus ammoniavirescens]|nr:thiamine pyrophosphokinase [Paxillus ammoniavirescens]
MGADISKLLYGQLASPSSPEVIEWGTSFLNPLTPKTADVRRALIILNQPFPLPLLETVWKTCSWRCCADGGGNRLHDLLGDALTENGQQLRDLYMPDLIKGDLDSLRQDVRDFYSSKGVPILHDPDQESTDLMKCVRALEEKEITEGNEYEIIFLGGLSGRLDQTVHTLSYLHKLRRTRKKVYAITDENIAWVLDEGQHRIRIDHEVLGPTCGLLPVGIESTTLSTSGLRWNLDGRESSFDGLISTSNHLVPEEQFVTIKTSRPIWWCAELRRKD